MPASITVVGSANVDLVVRQPRLPAEGETLSGTSFQTHPGGKGLNQAVAAARAGARVRFVGCVGDDDHGRRIHRLFAEQGIAAEALATTATSTGSAHISVLDSGENTIVVVPGANGDLTALGPAQAEAVRASDVLMTQFELPESVVGEALAEARSAGRRTVVTPAPARAIPAQMAEQIDLLIPNAVEICQLADTASVDEALDRLVQRIPAIVVTLGAAGCLVATRDGRERVEAPRVQAVDTTGAGDAFAGALVARWSEGATLIEAARWATTAGALAVQKPGAVDAIADRSAIDAAFGLTPPDR